ncbi:MAG: glycoside hydrolase family 97 C-terminal domain-containing protein, partial [Flavobacteriaceae bacterium]
IARKEKNSERWFIGNSNGELARISEIDLSFLDESQRYLATIYRDGEYADYKKNPQSYTIESREVTKQTTLQIKTVAAGGYAISLVPLE